MMDPYHNGRGSADLGRLIELLVEEVLDAPDGEQAAKLEDVCRAHPEHAGRLRRICAWIGEIDEAEAPWTAAAEPGAAPSEIGGYRLVELIGRGGMGLVYRAVRPGLDDRAFALKTIRPELVESAATRQRFVREARLASRLEHPQVCGVLDVGEDRSNAWLVMPFVEGRPLSDAIEAATRAQQDGDPRALPRIGPADDAPLRALVKAFALLARGVAHAHERRLLHRDVKPSNILVRPDGAPVLLDFGLARDTEDALRLTVSQDQVGTPAYMAPEQAESRRDLDERVDVYGLGVTLYECLTLQLPHAGSSRDEMLRRILRDPAPDPRRHRPWIPESLALIVRGAMARERQHRYRGAAELAADLTRFLEHRPILIRRPKLTSQVVCWARRNPWPAAMLLLLSVALLSVSLLAVQWLRAERLALHESLLTAVEVERHPWRRVRTAIAAFEIGSGEESLGAMVRAAADQYLLAELEPTLPDRFLIGDGLAVWSEVAERFVVVEHKTLRFCGRDGQDLGSLDTGANVQASATVRHAGEDRILLACHDGVLREWSSGTGEVTALAEDLPCDEHAARNIYTSAVSPDGDCVLFGFRSGAAYEWDVRRGVGRSWAHDAGSGLWEVRSCVYLQDGTPVTGALDRRDEAVCSIRIGRGAEGYVVPTEQLVTAVTEMGGEVSCVDESGTCWRLDRGLRRLERTGEIGPVTSKITRPGFSVLGGASGSVRASPPFGAVHGAPIPLHEGAVSALAEVSGLGWLVSGGEDRSLVVWTADGSLSPRRFTGLPSSARAIASTHDGQQLAVQCSNGTIQIWRLDEPVMGLRAESCAAVQDFFVAAEHRLWFASRDAALRLGRLGALGTTRCGGAGPGLFLHRIWPLEQRIVVGIRGGLALFDRVDGRLLAATGRRATQGVLAVRPWPAGGDGDLVAVLLGGSVELPALGLFRRVGDRYELERRSVGAEYVWQRQSPYWVSASISPDKRWAAVGCGDGHVEFLDLEALDPTPLRGPGLPLRENLGAGSVDCVDWGDGPRPRLAAGTSDGVVLVWERSGPDWWQLLHRVEVGAAVTSIQWSASSAALGATTVGGRVLVFDREARSRLRFGFGRAVYRCRFHDDDRRLAFSTHDGRILSIPLEEELLLTELRATLPR